MGSGKLWARARRSAACCGALTLQTSPTNSEPSRCSLLLFGLAVSVWLKRCR
mgnify:CR=1 FL=1